MENCHACRRSHVLRDKTPGLLNPLPIADRLWQYITIDFKSFLKDKLGYDAIIVFICRLSKRPISVPYYSIATIRDLAEMFIDRV